MTGELIVIESATKKDSSITATSSRMDRLGEAGKVFGLHGFVSYPAKGAKGIRIRLGRFSFVVSITRDDIAPPDNEGATKLYSTDADGVEKASMILDSDGKIGIKNVAENLAGLIDDLISEIIAIKTFGSPTNHSLTPASIANLTAINERFKSLVKDI